MYHPDHVPRLERQFPKSPAARTAFLGELRRSVATRRPDTVVLSSEGFFRPLADGALRRLHGELLDLGASAIEVAVYLRRPSEKYLSSLQQAFKASSRFPLPSSSAYREVLQPYVEVFGAASIKAHSFARESLLGGDITEDFCRSFLGPAGAGLASSLRRFRSNETLSAESMDIVRSFREAFHPGEDGRFNSPTNSLVRALVRLDFLHCAGRPRLRAGLAAAIDTASAADIRWVEQNLGLPLATPAGGAQLPRVSSVQELLVIDASLRKSLLLSLADSPWAVIPGWGDVRGWLCGRPLLPRRAWCQSMAGAADQSANALSP
jgi:hypothetical protein